MNIAQTKELLERALDEGVVGVVGRVLVNHQRIAFIITCCGEGLEERADCVGFMEGRSGDCAFLSEGRICMQERFNGREPNGRKR